MDSENKNTKKYVRIFFLSVMQIEGWVGQPLHSQKKQLTPLYIII